MDMGSDVVVDQVGALSALQGFRQRPQEELPNLTN
jgi:hypothetical protein